MRHNKKVSLTGIMGMLLATCALTACSSVVLGTASRNDGQVTISFVALSLDLGYYRTVAQEFNAAHPAIRVQVRDANTLLSPDDDLLPADVVRLLASSADAFFAYELDPVTLSTTGAVYDLQPLLETHQEFAGDLFPGLLERYQDNGGLWGIPAGVSPRVMLYNKALFDAAGVNHPQPGWTWDDFLTKALALTDRDAGVWGFAEQWRYDSVGASVYQHGGTLVDDDEPDFRDPLAAEALGWYADLARTHHVMPGPDSPDAPQPQGNGLALTGRCAMWTGFLDQNRSTDTGIAPLPRDRQDAAMATVYAYYVSAGTTQPGAAWQWINFLSQRPPETGLLPARRSVFDSSAYRSEVDDETYAAYQYILEHLESSPWPARYGWFAAAYNWLADKGLPAVIRGESDATGVLAEAQSRALAAMSQAPETGPTPVIMVQPTAASPNAASLTFLQMRSVGGVYEELARTYRQEHPGIAVEVIGFESEVDYTPERMASIADVFPVSPGFRVADIEAHWLNLQPLVESDPGLALDDFYPQALDAYRRQGSLWGLPTEIDARLLFYNKALFDQAGVPYPQPGWTWDDFLAADAQLTRGKDAEKQWGFVTLINGWEDIPLIVAAQQGGSLVNSRTAPTAPTLDDPAVMDALRWYTGLCRAYGVMPPPATHYADWEQMETLVSAGRAAMWISNAGYKDWTRENVDLGFAPLPVPSGGGQPATIYSVYGYGISAQTPDPQEAWRWLTFLTWQPGAVRVLPTRRSLAAQTALPFMPPESRAEALRVYQLTLDGYADAGYDGVRAQAPWFDVIYRLYHHAVKQTLEDGTDPAENLHAAQAVAEAYMACLETHGGLTDPVVGGACEAEAGVPAPVVWYEE